MSYKYRKIPPNKKVVFAEVIKPAIWIGKQISKHGAKPHPGLPVGAITWFNPEYVSIDDNCNQYLHPERSVCPERNRYGWNFDPACFELLHTTIKKVRK